MNPEFYRTHSQPAIRRAYRSGKLAALAGLPLDANPYRHDIAGREPRRGSWSEAYTKAWAAGWHHVQVTAHASAPEPAAPAHSPGGEQ